jgi:hypothetical protein
VGRHTCRHLQKPVRIAKFQDKRKIKTKEKKKSRKINNKEKIMIK